jgi:uncharacterized membrane protein YgaE (UPF0421/DUF939 family)
MIRFFRDIRQKLTAENKVAKYLRYAIGEIMLVVIGILIALQVNNWNEIRKERLVEIKYLKNLKHDLQSDSTDLVYYKNIQVGQANAAQELIKLAKTKNVSDVFKLDSLYTTVALWWEFVPNNNTFEELRSSGNLKLLRNDTIKNLLLDLNKENEDLVSSRNHMRREYENYLYDQKNNQVNFLDVNDPEQIKNIIDWYYPDRQNVAKNSDKLKKRYQILFNNTLFINGLALTAGNILWMIEENYNKMQDIVNKLIKLIDQDLETSI